MVEVPGLGLNIVRYNAGASSEIQVDGQAMVVGPQMYTDRSIETFWPNWQSNDPASKNWDWSVDRSQREMMWKARDRGVDTFELFSKSPVWWMCQNRNPAGADDGWQDNLLPNEHNQFAVYLASVVKYTRDNWGVAFGSVSPFNGPTDYWSGTNGTQEGCHFEPKTQASVINELRKELDSRGLEQTVIAASDESTYDQGVKSWQALKNEGVADKVGKINVHGYSYGTGPRDVLNAEAAAAGRRVWMSEYSKDDFDGMDLVSNIILDLRWLRPTAWLYWQVFDGGGWGLIQADTDIAAVESPSQTYYTLAQFTRHIRPGMRMLDSGCDYAVAAYDARNSRLVIVAANWGEARSLDFDLSRFSKPSTEGHVVSRWSTGLGTGDRYEAHLEDTKIQGKRFWSWFGANMTQTFEIWDVVL